MVFWTREAAIILAALLVAKWSAPVVALKRYIDEMKNGQKQRRLFGERLGRRDQRGGAAGLAKADNEFVPMMERVVVPAPTVTTPTEPMPTPTEPVPSMPAPTIEAPVASTSSPQAPTSSRSCRFESPDGTVTTFDEGESMGTFSTLTDCFNGNPEEYPCFCSSEAPDQTVCPYCQFEDISSRTVCAKDNVGLQFIPKETSVLTECLCSVSTQIVDGLFSAEISSSCQPVDILGGQEGPTTMPTATPTESPTGTPAGTPTNTPTTSPTGSPTGTPTGNPTDAPTTTPTKTRTSTPTGAPMALPTVSPTASPVAVTYAMGRLNKVENGLTLSQGLRSIVIARSSQNVLYDSGDFSDIPFHNRPAGDDTFVDTRGDNHGGSVYVSSKDSQEGGIGALTFNALGDVINYEMILEGTQANSIGGRTPWDTWVTGERLLESLNGEVFQVDPLGVRNTSLLFLTEEGGACAYDDRDAIAPRFFMSEDYYFGCVRRFTPASANADDPWLMLEEEGRMVYLILQPGTDNVGGTFIWTNEIILARANAAQTYPKAQGIDVNGSTLSFVCQDIKKLFQLKLDDGTYTVTSTVSGLMEGEPNEIHYVEGDAGTLL